MLKQILVAPAEEDTLEAASSIHCQSLNQSWTSPGVTEEENVQRAVNLGGGQHAGTLQPGLWAHAQSSDEAIQSADVPGFRRKVMFCVAKSATVPEPQRKDAVPFSESSQ